MSRSERPLFIPLRGVFWDAFADGRKTVEYRLYGKRWNESTCYKGRRVVLSRGYGKRHRLTGRVVLFQTQHDATSIPGWTECYPGVRGVAACIHIAVDRN